ncbi:MAG: hypothetical protein GXP42_06210 [Chloroflexi bacterium]|nr:hypothetical protein [Chloroflexota bacterium]
MQGIGVFVAILLLLGLNVRPAHAQEDEKYPGGFTLIPVKAQSIRLLSMIVDAHIREAEDGQVYVDIQAVYRVHNRNKKGGETLSVAFPGYAVDGPPIDQVTLKAGKREIRFSEARTQWWIADVDLKADERVNLLLSYTARLGDAAVLRFRYPLELTAQQWAGALESARFTLAFDEPPNPQSWLKLTPQNYQLTAESITWSYEAKDPARPIDYVFLRPSLWRELREARRAAAASNASAEDFLALGEIYGRLATLEKDSNLFERYFPLAVAAYNQAQVANPTLARPYLALAQLYGLKAEQSQPPDPSYLALATSQLGGALQHGVQDAAIVDAAARNYALLITQARLRGDFEAANQYLKEAEMVSEKAPALSESPLMQEAKRRLAIDWAESVFQDQGSGPARRVLTELFGADVVTPNQGSFARISSLHVETETAAGMRVLRIQAAPREDGEALVTQLFRALSRTETGKIMQESAETPTLRIELMFESAEELAAALRSLAEVTPDEPEWAMLHALLRPELLLWEQQDEGWRSEVRFSERVNLSAVANRLDEEAAKLEAAATSLNEADPLESLLARVWRAEAQVWRRLLENNRARYTLTMHPEPGAPIVRIWSLEPGDDITMSGQAMRYNIVPYLIGALAGYFVILIALLTLRGLWMRLSERRKSRA